MNGSNELVDCIDISEIQTNTQAHAHPLVKPQGFLSDHSFWGWMWSSYLYPEKERI